MKKLLIALAVLVVLLIGAGAYVISNLSVLVARFQPDIEKQLSRQIGVPVALGKLDVSVFPHVEFSTKAVSVGEGLSVASIAAKVSLSELLNKKLAIESLTIESPRVILEKTAAGFGVKGLPTAKKTDTEEPAKKPEVVKPASGNSNFSSPLAIELSGMSVKNGTVTVEGLPQVSPLIVGNIDFATALAVSGDTIIASNLSLSAIPQGLSALTVSAPSATIKGQHVSVPQVMVEVLKQKGIVSADLDLATKKGAAEVTFANFDVSSLDQLKTLVPAVEKFSLTGAIRPTFHFDLAGENPVGIKGNIGLEDVGAKLPNLSVDKVSGNLEVAGTPANLNAEIKDLKLSLNNEPVNAQIAATVAGDQATVTKFSAQGFGGIINVTARTDFAIKDLAASVSLQSLVIPTLMKTFVPTAPELTGKINGASVSIKTVRPEGKIPERISGPITASLSDITVPKLQIIQPIIKALEAIPSLGALGVNGASLSPQQTAALQAGETNFSSIIVSTALDGNGNLGIQSFVGEAGIFTLNGRGSASVKGSLSLDAEVVFSDALSTYLTSRSPGLKYAAGKDGRIIVPVVITKDGNGFRVLPNIQKITETAVTRGLVDQAGKALNKTLGNKLGGVLGSFLN